MSDHIDETSLTDEEVAAAIAEARAKKAKKAAKKAEEEKTKQVKLEKAGSIDEDSSNALLSESSSAAALEEAEDESPAVRSAKSFSNAFAAAKKKREMDLLKKKEKKSEEPEDDEDEDEDLAAAASVDSDASDDAEFETDDEEEEYEYEEDEYEYEDEDEEEDSDEEDEDEDEDEDGDFDGDGIFETDDENGEYNTTVNVDEGDDDDDEYEDDEEDEDEDDEDDSAFSSKTKVIIGIVIAILVIAIIAAVAFFMKGSGDKEEVSSVASVVESDIKSVKFAESSISLEVGETKPLKLIVEPENAKDKTFKLKSNDETIAKVNEKGEITGIASGSTTVTATLKSNPTMTASLVVNVIDEEQSTLNTYNKFINMILDGSTDIDSESDTDTESEVDEENAEEETDTDTASDSDTDSENRSHTPTHTLTGNKIEDLDSDGSMELALYYDANTDNEEPLVRIFRLAPEDEEETETDSEEEELMYDEFGNLIEQEETDTETETDTATDSEKDSDGAPKAKVLKEVDQYSERYMTMHSALEADSATNPWNTSYLQVKEGEQATARVKILSEGYSAPTYTFESEDEEIATVDKQGNIKGVKPGTVFITVSSPLNSDAVAKVKVRVKDDTDLLDDYLASIPVVNNTNDTIFPTETLTGKAIVDIDNDGVSELMLRFRYSDNVEVINMVKIENEKCVVYKTYNNLSDLYEYGEGDGSYNNSILIHYTSGRVCLDYKATVAKEGSKSRSSEEKIFTIESGGSLSELVNFRTTTDVSTKTVTSEVSADDTSSKVEEDDTDSEQTYYDEDSDSETEIETDSETLSDDTSSTSSYVDEDEDGYDDITGEYFGSFAAFDFDDIEAAAESGNGIDLTMKKPVKTLPQTAAAPDDEDDEDEEVPNDNNDDVNDNDNDNDNETTSSEETTSTVTTEVAEETTKYFVNGTPTEKSVYEEIITRYSATYSVWNAWESVY